MPDYRHDLQFGVFITPVAEQAEAVVELSRMADTAGLDIVSFQDHPYQPSFLDTWTLLSVVAAETTHVRVAPNVANVPLRPPVMLARSAASLDILSGGRVELGLGSGAFWDGIAAVGGPRWTPGQGVDALSEAIDVMRLVWSDEPSVTYDGKHYRLKGYKPGPQPAHPIGIWLGAYKPRMLRLTGEKADGWVPSLMGRVTPADLGELDRQVTAAAEAIGRDPAEVRRIWNIPAQLLDDRDVAAQLANWSERYGVDTFVLWPGQEKTTEQVERFAAARDAIGVTT